MNKNIDLTKILKDCPKGTKLYSIIYGEVEFNRIEKGDIFSIIFVTKEGNEKTVISDGKYFSCYNGDCTLFPSKDQRDWSKFKPKKPKFDPKTLKPFDRVLARVEFHGWFATWYSHTINNKMMCDNNIAYHYCIPYNEETKHLVGKAEEAPEYYRYWED